MKSLGLITSSLLLIAGGAFAQQQVVVTLPTKSDNIKVPSNFHGLSLELTQMNDYFGMDPSHHDAGFMQLLRNIKDRTGSLMLRVGGNSQDTAFPDESIVGGIEKTTDMAVRVNSAATTFNVKVSSRVFDVMNSVSQVTGAKWMFGLNFEDPNNMDSAKVIGKQAVEKLGDNLFAMQIGNEPDLYSKHGIRTADWGIPQYIEEWSNWANALHQEFGTSLKKNDIFTGAVVCCSWNISDVLHAGLMEHGNNMQLINSITVQKYSSNNCFGKAKGDYTDYLNHQWIVGIPKQLYSEAADIAKKNNKMLIMGETNTAACGGLPNVSDTYVSALWGVDWLMYLASLGFSSASLQIGGKKTLYNPMNNIDGVWHPAPIYYSSMVVTEAVGKDQDAQFENIDLASTTLSSYAVFHKEQFKYAVLLNTDIAQEASFKLQGGWAQVPSEVKIKRLVAPHYEERNNITWGGQTFNGATDGRLQGDLVIETVKCEADGCTIRLPPTSVAVVGSDIDVVEATSVTENPYVDAINGIGNSGNNGAGANGSGGSGTTATDASTQSRASSVKSNIMVGSACLGLISAAIISYF
ncbi:hypothetical protein NQZ79_g2548 [Umbelopsis isabellina]|nr:hypothetical protein NQZ79_g2548 [Umbelopsis isabellina]